MGVLPDFNNLVIPLLADNEVICIFFFFANICLAGTHLYSTLQKCLRINETVFSAILSPASF